jgi:hypothetical protein
MMPLGELVRRILLAFGMALALAGCASQKIEDLPKVSPTEAIASFQQLGYGEWAQNPYIRKESICSAEKVNVQFSDFKIASFSLRQSTLMLTTTKYGICGGNYVFHLKDLDDARRLVGAIQSLGAKVEYFVVRD